MSCLLKYHEKMFQFTRIAMTNKKRVVYDVTLLFSVFINMIFFTYFFHQHLRTLSSLTGLRGAPEVPPLCRETQSLGQHMFDLGCETATVGTNGLTWCMGLRKTQSVLDSNNDRVFPSPMHM